MFWRKWKKKKKSFKSKSRIHMSNDAVDDDPIYEEIDNMESVVEGDKPEHPYIQSSVEAKSEDDKVDYFKAPPSIQIPLEKLSGSSSNYSDNSGSSYSSGGSSSDYSSSSSDD